MKSLSRFVSISSEDSPWTVDRPRFTSAARATLCAESADPGFRPVQPAGRFSLADVTGLKNTSRLSISTEEPRELSGSKQFHYKDFQSSLYIFLISDNKLLDFYLLDSFPKLTLNLMSEVNVSQTGALLLVFPYLCFCMIFHFWLRGIREVNRK